MRILVTGAAGDLGSETVTRLHEAGHDVVATDRRSRDDLPVAIRQLDLLDAGGVEDLARGVDAVVHAASLRWPEVAASGRSFVANVAMTSNVFRAAATAQVQKLVYVSSIQAMVHEGTGGSWEEKASHIPYLPFDGDCPAQPSNPYACSKVVGEILLRDHVTRPGMDCVAIRYSSLWHAAPDERWGVRLQPLSRPEPEAYIVRGFASLSFADAARLIRACLEASLPGFRTYLAAACVIPPELVPAYVKRYYGDVPLKKPVETLTSLFDVSRIERETGWMPRDLPRSYPPGERLVDRVGLRRVGSRIKRIVLLRR